MYLSPTERRLHHIRRCHIAVYVLIGAIVVTWLDPILFRALLAPETERAEWYQMLRAVGYIPLWVLVGFAFVLVDHRRMPGRPRLWRRGLLIMGSASICGGAAEVFKVIIGRHRPINNHARLEDGTTIALPDGEYYFKIPFAEFIEGAQTGNLGLPSSHAAVAFGGAAMIGLLFPPTRWYMLAIAGACAVTRMLSGAHFATDVYASAVIGLVTAALLHRRFPD